MYFAGVGINNKNDILIYFLNEEFRNLQGWLSPSIPHTHLALSLNSTNPFGYTLLIQTKTPWMRLSNKCNTRKTANN